MSAIGAHIHFRRALIWETATSRASFQRGRNATTAVAEYVNNVKDTTLTLFCQGKTRISVFLFRMGIVELSLTDAQIGCQIPQKYRAIITVTYERMAISSES